MGTVLHFQLQFQTRRVQNWIALMVIYKSHNISYTSGTLHKTTLKRLSCLFIRPQKCCGGIMLWRCHICRPSVCRQNDFRAITLVVITGSFWIFNTMILGTKYRWYRKPTCLQTRDVCYLYMESLLFIWFWRDFLN